MALLIQSILNTATHVHNYPIIIQVNQIIKEIHSFLVVNMEPTQDIYDIHIHPQEGAFCNGVVNVLDPTVLPSGTLFHVAGPERLIYSSICGTGWTDQNAQVRSTQRLTNLFYGFLLI